MLCAAQWSLLCGFLGGHVRGHLKPVSTRVLFRPLRLHRLPLHQHCLHMNSMAKPAVVFVLGRPGSGKGTQCTRISQDYAFEHLSAGDLLREERNDPKSEFGAMIEEHIRNGTIVPVEVTCALLEKAMVKSAGNRFLIDGFPRSQDNLDGWERVMAPKVDLKFVLYFDCPEEECVKRCLERGEGGSGRSDDNPASLQKRVVTYSTVTEPIINHFITLDMVRKVDAADDVNTVFSRVQTVFELYGYKGVAAGDS